MEVEYCDVETTASYRLDSRFRRLVSTFNDTSDVDVRSGPIA